MNIGEANDVNTVLRALLAPPVDGSAVDLVRVEAAAERLIERANKTLGAGMTPVDVRLMFAAWVARRRTDIRKQRENA
jgi:hypothetical protein